MQASELLFNYPQADFINSSKPFRGFCGGYRSGKTFVGCGRFWILASKYPGIKLGYFAPTYPMIRDIFYSTIEEVANLFSVNLGLNCAVEINKSDHFVRMYINGLEYATVICRSMDNPSRIVGFDINHALVDEIDTLKKHHADEAWKKIIARLSSPGFDEKRLYSEEFDSYLVIEALESNTVDFTTTPEGFNWMHDFFVVQLQKRPELQAYYELIKASTRQNAANLPADYIDKLYATYPQNLVDAYVDGEFVNLTSGQIYTQYDQLLNGSSQQVEKTDRVLIVGMDFNVTKMSARVFVTRGKEWHCVDELNDLYDTPDMIEHLKMRYPDKRLVIYPDASGKNRKSNGADITDIKQLKNAGFQVKAKDSNPRVRTRINSVNAMFCNSMGERRLFVNRLLCPQTHNDLTQQVYNKNGEPDKSSGNDHGNDAFGYPVVYEHEIGAKMGVLNVYG